jgi:glutaredoxin 3
MGSSSSSAASSSPEVRQEIDRMIEDNQVMIFSKTYCPYCSEAKRAIEKLGLTYIAIELDVRASVF